MPQTSSREWNLDPVLDWLLETGRFSDELDTLIFGLGQQLVTQGAPFDRIRIAMRTLNPLTTGVSATWNRNQEKIPLIRAEHGLDQQASYIGSPMEIIVRTRRPFRYRFDAPVPPEAHRALHELADQGLTDYFGIGLKYVYGSNGILLVGTRTAQGFSDHDIDKITRLSAVLTPVLEAYRQQHLALSVSEAYLGRRSAARVLGGEITRGHVEAIDAAIMVSDLRGWTALNTQKPPQEALALVNAYYDILDAAIMAHDGEILKFMGDGVLAVFPNEDTSVACNNALNAAQAALSQAAETDLSATFGVALHHGRVQFGNIGAASRLDFTVMGAAVNYAARLESYSKMATPPIVMSERVSDFVFPSTHVLVKTDLKGVSGEQTIFALQG